MELFGIRLSISNCYCFFSSTFISSSIINGVLLPDIFLEIGWKFSILPATFFSLWVACSIHFSSDFCSKLSDEVSFRNFVQCFFCNYVTPAYKLQRRTVLVNTYKDHSFKAIYIIRMKNGCVQLSVYKVFNELDVRLDIFLIISIWRCHLRT